MVGEGSVTSQCCCAVLFFFLQDRFIFASFQKRNFWENSFVLHRCGQRGITVWSTPLRAFFCRQSMIEKSEMQGDLLETLRLRLSLLSDKELFTILCFCRNVSLECVCFLLLKTTKVGIVLVVVLVEMR